MSLLQIEEMIKKAGHSNDYKIIRRYDKVASYNISNDEDKSIGVFVDVETTGSNPYKDKIIEIALIPFEYDESGKIFNIRDSYVGFQDPKIPIPQIITELTGITDEMVAGHSFDIEKIKLIASSASIIIAHHAAFDKKFVEKAFKIFRSKLWGCTVAHIKWRQEKIASSKLEYLAYKFGVFYEAHRAEIDSLIGIHILAQELPVSKKLALKVLLENAKGKYVKIWAENTPFEKKDILKTRGYRWSNGNNNKPKSWHKTIIETSKDQELEFLYQEIYQEVRPLKIEMINLFEES